MSAPTPMYDEKIALNGQTRELSTPSSHSSTPSLGENASYYNEKPPPYGPDEVGPVGADGERGLGSTLLGGAGGAFIGHQMGGGMATAGGAVLGALGANAVSHGIENHHQNQQQQQQQQQYYQPPPPQGYPQSYYSAYQQPPYPAPAPGPGYAPSMPGTTVTTTTTYSDYDIRHGRHRRRKEKDCCIGRMLHGGRRRDERFY